MGRRPRRPGGHAQLRGRPRRARRRRLRCAQACATRSRRWGGGPTNQVQGGPPQRAVPARSDVPLGTPRRRLRSSSLVWSRKPAASSTWRSRSRTSRSLQAASIAHAATAACPRSGSGRSPPARRRPGAATPGRRRCAGGASARPRPPGSTGPGPARRSGTPGGRVSATPSAFSQSGLSSTSSSMRFLVSGPQSWQTRSKSHDHAQLHLHTARSGARRGVRAGACNGACGARRAAAAPDRRRGASRSASSSSARIRATRARGLARAHGLAGVVADAVAAARAAQPDWAATPLAERVAALRRMATLIGERTRRDRRRRLGRDRQDAARVGARGAGGRRPDRDLLRPHGAQRRLRDPARPAVREERQHRR